MTTSAHLPGAGERLGPARTVEVADRVFAYLQPDGSWWINNTGFVVGSDGVLAVDASSTERRTRSFLEAIRSVTSEKVRVLVNTHHHGDHTNGNCLFDDALIVGHTKCREQMLRQSIGGLEQIFGPVEWGDLEVSAPTLTFDEARASRRRRRASRAPLRRRSRAHHRRRRGLATGIGRAVRRRSHLRRRHALCPHGVRRRLARGARADPGLRCEHDRPGPRRDLRPRSHRHGGGLSRLRAEPGAEGFAAGLSPLEAAREADLGPYAELRDSERIVGNLHRAYQEIEGLALGSPIDVLNAFADMIAFNGGGPLRCLA